MKETTSKKCPYCQLINPKSAPRCDCGFEFSDYLVSPQERELGKMLRKKSGLRWIGGGVAGIILGILFTLLFSVGTSKAGFNVVFWGLVGGGLISIYRGIMMILGIR
jgi:hypothetical protein